MSAARDAVLAFTLFVLLVLLVPLFGYDIMVKYLGIDRGLVEKSPPLVLYRSGIFILPVFLSKKLMFQFGMILTGIAAALYPIARYRYYEMKALRLQVNDFLPLVSSYVATGAPIIHALLNISSMMKPPLSRYLEKYARMVMLGHDPEKAFDRVFKNVPKEVKVILRSLVIAMASGGNVSESLEEANRYLMLLNRMEETRTTRLAEYRMIVLMAIVAFALAGFIVIKLIESIASVPTAIPGTKVVNIDFLISSYFYSAIILILLGSITTSRMITGTFVIAPKYIAMLTAFVTLLFTVIEPMIRL